MNLGRVGVIYLKELIETLRDKRTLFVMVLLPILLYPLIFIGLTAVMESHLAQISGKAARVAIWAGSDNAPMFERVAQFLGDTPDDRIEVLDLVEIDGGDTRRTRCDAAAAALVDELAEVIVLVDGDAPCTESEAAPPADQADRAAVVGMQVTASWRGGGALGRVDVLYDGANDLSRAGAGRVEIALETLSRTVLSEHLTRAGLDPALVAPLAISRSNVASDERMGGHFASRILPMLLVLMVILGAFYPAIDLTAGEKERGTLESLISAPVRPVEIAAGKYMAVVSISMIAATVNLASMGLTLNRMTAQLPFGGAVALTLDGAVTVLVLLLPTALLFSALLLAIASLARDFKEAQNFLTPVLMICIVPAALAGLPGIELNLMTAFAPGVNITLVIKAVLTGEADPGVVFAVMLANGIYAGLTLVVAGRLFASELVLFGNGGGAVGRGPRAWWAWLKSPASDRTLPSPGLAMLFFMTMLVLLYYFGSSMQARDLIRGLVWTEWGLVLLPALGFAAAGRVDLRETFLLYLPSRRGLMGTLLVALSGWTLALAAAALTAQVLPDTRTFAETFRKIILAATADMSTPALLVVFAVSPAICEEVAFRGIILAGLRSRLGRWPSILLVAALFGAFHLSLYRFLPTALLGLVITYAVWQTRSLLAGVLIHFVSNALIFSLERFEPFGHLLGFTEGEIGNWVPVAICSAGLPVGLWLLSRERSRA